MHGVIYLHLDLSTFLWVTCLLVPEVKVKRSHELLLLGQIRELRQPHVAYQFDTLVLMENLSGQLKRDIPEARDL